jgi:hypothetical protein
MDNSDNEQFTLGRMVGETLGRISEQERIIALLEDLDVTVTDEDDEPVEIIQMDWTRLITEIRGHSEEDSNASDYLD